MAAAHEERKQVPLTSLHGEEDTERIVVDEGERAPFFAKQRENWMETFVDKTCGALDKSAKMRIYFGPKKKRNTFFLL